MVEGGRSFNAINKDCICKTIEKEAGASHNIVNTSEMRTLRQTKLELEQQLKGKKNGILFGFDNLVISYISY